jgi:hypothetical protein
VIVEERVATNPEAMTKTFEKTPSSRIALETGTHSPWVSRLLTELGHEAIVAQSRNVRLIEPSQCVTAESGIRLTTDRGRDGFTQPIAASTARRVQFALDYEF